eukprot:CAMPEP_0194238556 /NCGR_PEP_ID=MMETSP0158-20130606/5272_1 /TAXON_ID=33649 /ORGANISM="Thalassionema nitzschioides, Strain L26-B" /LENGTH=391 /DNA_ID=CAMNT_0038972837 /DNA_START=36 /DNA_END=1208 /DNA_ORIENTATION=+
MIQSEHLRLGKLKTAKRNTVDKGAYRTSYVTPQQQQHHHHVRVPQKKPDTRSFTAGNNKQSNINTQSQQRVADDFEQYPSNNKLPPFQTDEDNNNDTTQSVKINGRAYNEDSLKVHVIQNNNNNNNNVKKNDDDSAAVAKNIRGNTANQDASFVPVAESKTTASAAAASGSFTTNSNNQQEILVPESLPVKSLPVVPTVVLEAANKQQKQSSFQPRDKYYTGDNDRSKKTATTTTATTTTANNNNQSQDQKQQEQQGAAVVDNSNLYADQESSSSSPLPETVAEMEQHYKSRQQGGGEGDDWDDHYNNKSRQNEYDLNTSQMILSDKAAPAAIDKVRQKQDADYTSHSIVLTQEEEKSKINYQSFLRFQEKRQKVEEQQDDKDTKNGTTAA